MSWSGLAAVQLVRDTATIFSPAARRRCVVWVLGSVALSAIEVVAALMVPALLLLLVSSPTGAGGSGLATWAEGELGSPTAVVVVLVVAFVLKDVAAAAFRFWALGFVRSNEAESATTILGSYLSESLERHVQRSPSGSLHVLHGSVGAAYSLVALAMVSIVAEVLTIGGLAAAVALWLPPEVLALVAAMSLVMIAIVLALGRVSQRLGAEHGDVSKQSYRLALRAIGGYREVLLRDGQVGLVSKFGAVSQRGARVAQVAGFIPESPRFLLQIFFLLGIAAAAVAADGRAQTTGAVGISLVAAFRVMPSVSRLVAAVAQVQHGAPAVAEVADELRRARSIAPAEPVTRPLTFTRAITFDDVRFSYRRDGPPVLAGLEGELPRGSRIALVGPSGAGKSTLVDILTGVITDYDGTIRIDGIPLRGNERAWREHVAVVVQDPYIFEATLRDNIVFDVDAVCDDDRLVTAVEHAQLGDLVAGLPEGVHTVLAERGSGLSGGQRQRIAIARALYRGASVLIMDEATASLDADAERLVATAVADLPGVTLIVIAHRLATVAQMDQVVVLDGGRFAAAGTFHDVRRTNATFARWVRHSEMPRHPSAAPPQ